MSESIANSRRNNFDALRLALATLVVFSHCYQLTGTGDPLYSLTHGHDSLGHLAVDGFFGISGYLVTQSWASRPVLRTYLLKRVLRIYPGFIAACLFCVVVIAPIGADSVSQYFSDLSWPKVFARIGLLLPLHLPLVFVEQPHSRAINGSLWSIFYEFICYLFVPVVAWLGWLKKRGWVVAAFLACYLLYLAYPTGQPGDDSYLISPRIIIQQLMFFSAGMVAYLYRERLGNYLVVALVCFIGMLVATPLGALPFVTPFLVAPLMIGLAFSPNLHLHHAAKYGDFSYGIYLYAYPLTQSLVRLSGNSIPPLALFPAAFLLSLGAAWVSWHFVESVALSWKSKLK